MNDDENNHHEDPGIEAWIDPAWETRIVALLQGEASDFETEDLEKQMRGNPELRVFHRRMKAVHGLLEAAVGDGGNVEGAGADEWKLSPERREAVLARLREKAEVPAEVGGTKGPKAMNVVEVECPKAAELRRRKAWTWAISSAAALFISLFMMAGLLFRRYEAKSSAPMDVAFEAESEAMFYDVAAGERDYLQANREKRGFAQSVRSKPSAPVASATPVVPGKPESAGILANAPTNMTVAVLDSPSAPSPSLGEESFGEGFGGDGAQVAADFESHFGDDVRRYAIPEMMEDLPVSGHLFAGTDKAAQSVDTNGEVAQVDAPAELGSEGRGADGDGWSRETRLGRGKSVTSLGTETMPRTATRATETEDRFRWTSQPGEVTTYRTKERDAGQGKGASEKLDASGSEGEGQERNAQVVDTKNAADFRTDLNEPVAARVAAAEEPQMALPPVDPMTQGIPVDGAELVSEGKRLLAGEDYEGARATLKAAVETLPESPETRAARTEAVDLFADTSTLLAHEQALAGRFDSAGRVLEEVLETPGAEEHKGAKRQLARLDDREWYNRAELPEDAAKAGEAERLKQLGSDSYDLGDLDMAEKQYDDLLRIDPTDAGARKGLEDVDKARLAYQSSAQDHTRAGLMREVDQLWETEVPSLVVPETPASEPSVAEVTAGKKIALDDFGLVPSAEADAGLGAMPESDEHGTVSNLALADDTMVAGQEVEELRNEMSLDSSGAGGFGGGGGGVAGITVPGQSAAKGPEAATKSAETWGGARFGKDALQPESIDGLVAIETKLKENVEPPAGNVPASQPQPQEGQANLSAFWRQSGVAGEAARPEGEAVTTVNLESAPEVVEFEGFVNGGAPIAENEFLGGATNLRGFGYGEVPPPADPQAATATGGAPIGNVAITGAALPESEVTLGFDVGAGYDSKYLFRGVDVADGGSNRVFASGGIQGGVPSESGVSSDSYPFVPPTNWAFTTPDVGGGEKLSESTRGREEPRDFYYANEYDPPEIPQEFGTLDVTAAGKRDANIRREMTIAPGQDFVRDGEDALNAVVVEQREKVDAARVAMLDVMESSDLGDLSADMPQWIDSTLGDEDSEQKRSVEAARRKTRAGSMDEKRRSIEYFEARNAYKKESDLLAAMVEARSGNGVSPASPNFAKDFLAGEQLAVRGETNGRESGNWKEMPADDGTQIVDGRKVEELASLEMKLEESTPETPTEPEAEAKPVVAPEPAPVEEPAAPVEAQPEIETAVEPASTFSLHVSDVSFKLAAAALLEKGEWPAAGKVRIEEFVNAFDYGDPSPTQDEAVACRTEQAAHPFLPQRNLLRVAMRTGATGRASSQPLRLTVLLDKSGSMERADREASVQRAMEALASHLSANDAVTLIGFARQPRLIADRLSGERANELAGMVERAPSEGGTNLEEALNLAAAKAKEQFVEGGQNRIVLLTDGAANLGNARPESLGERVVALRQQGIAFDACGVGADGLNDAILEALTRKGDGRYYFLNRAADADESFVRQLAGALRPAAKNVKVQVIFNPERVTRYRLLGFEKHLLKKEDFRNDTVDAAEMAAAEAGVGMYEMEMDAAGEGDVGEVFVRFQDMATGEMVERSWTIPYEAGAPALDAATPSMKLAGTAAYLGMKLRGGPDAGMVRFDEFGKVTSELRSHYAASLRVQGLLRMVEKVREGE